MGKQTEVIPVVVVIVLMYRDAANYKTVGEDYFTNTKGLSLDYIKEQIQTLGEDPIIVEYYGIKGIAAMDNEFLPTDPNSDDHSYCEILEVTASSEELCGFAPDKDISEVIDAILNPDIPKARKEQASLDAIKTMHTQIKDIGVRNRIMIILEGGLVQNVITNIDAEYVVIDHDLPESEPLEEIDISIEDADLVLEPGQKFSGKEVWDANNLGNSKEEKHFIKLLEEKGW